MEHEYKCSDCAYCGTTNSFMTRWCSYWNKMTFLTGSCFRDTTVLDYDYDPDLDEDIDFYCDDDDI